MTGVILPELGYLRSPNQSPRYGHPVELVVVHRWGVKYVNQDGEAASYGGVLNWFKDPANKVSSHIVYAGTAPVAPLYPATQMVGWSQMAWTEAAYNPVADEVESADAIWLGHDPEGMATLARIVAFRLHVRSLPPVWSIRRGFCRHADLGAAGGGHLECPTTDMTVWRHFVSLVEAEAARGGFRDHWGIN